VTGQAGTGPSPARVRRWAVAALVTARPRQWPKNLLVLAAPLAGATLGRDDGAAYALVAAAAFTLASAAVYLANDVADAERDRLHPRKRHRPVAVGDLPKVPAAVLSAACAAAGTAAGLVTGVPLLTTAVAGYLVLSFLYSAVLKHVAGLEPAGWHLASGLPLAAALVRFGVLTGRGTAAAVEDLVIRNPMSVSWRRAQTKRA
jgi:decaprenyl-phosphate phosphoribosyltransferase